MLSSFFTLSHLFSQQLCGEGNPVPIWQPEKQRPGRWACQEERFQPHRPTPEHKFSVTLLPASWIYKSLKFHCCFHLIKITNTHVWFRFMTSLLNFFSQTQFLKWRKNKVYSPRPWFEVQDGESRASILCGASFLWIIHCANTRHQKGLGLTAQAVVPTASKVNCPFFPLSWEPGRDSQAGCTILLSAGHWYELPPGWWSSRLSNGHTQEYF